MNSKYIYLSLALLLFAGCATTHPGTIGTAELHNKNLPLVVSAESVSDNDESFELIYLTFENKGDHWVKIDDVEVPLNSSDLGKISVVVGKDLKDWASAVEERARMKEHNKEVALTSIALAGAVATAATSSSRHDSTTAATVNAAGLIAMTGTLAYAIGDTISTSQTMANSPKKVPENHVYQPFSVPGKLFIRKWLLLNKPSGEKITKLVLNIKTIEGERETYDINL